ncbi:hypothetical protein KIN20_007416 [Parelaphostrongylus tenuis]|uniref:Uncharacterized protein n=1 Tax=Parelaphostrongylus tenuis TaxID=148309 RepID=A0AAD5QGV2_PARTN|nr:hypothetical protein KIN20_007416 [Parelaphostrongylus tenuis]
MSALFVSLGEDAIKPEKRARNHLTHRRISMHDKKHGERSVSSSLFLRSHSSLI